MILSYGDMLAKPILFKMISIFTACVETTQNFVLCFTRLSFEIGSEMKFILREMAVLEHAGTQMNQTI